MTKMKRHAPGEGRLRVNFLVSPDKVWAGIGTNYESDIAELIREPRGTIGSWLLRTFVELSRIDYPVSISDRSLPGCINIGDTFNFGRRQRLNDHFVVLVRSDGPFPSLGNFVIHQNGLLPVSETSWNIPHWPHHGLVPRKSGRENRVRKLVFKGRAWNLDERFRTDAFVASLAELGVMFDFPAENSPQNEANWFDYSDCDAVIAVRNLTRDDASIKPASKLVNAWIAGIPAFLGPEPAFQELRQTPLDFFEVRRPEEVIDGLRRLNEQPDLYSAVAENARKRAVPFLPERLVVQWQDMLEGPIADAYHRWINSPKAHRWLQVTGMHLRFNKYRRAHVRGINEGPRILD